MSRASFKTNTCINRHLVNVGAIPHSYKKPSPPSCVCRHMWTGMSPISHEMFHSYRGIYKKITSVVTVSLLQFEKCLHGFPNQTNTLVKFNQPRNNCTSGKNNAQGWTPWETEESMKSMAFRYQALLKISHYECLTGACFGFLFPSCGCEVYSLGREIDEQFAIHLWDLWSVNFNMEDCLIANPVIFYVTNSFYDINKHYDQERS